LTQFGKVDELGIQPQRTTDGLGKAPFKFVLTEIGEGWSTAKSEHGVPWLLGGKPNR
jgi:hypothetical protein